MNRQGHLRTGPLFLHRDRNEVSGQRTFSTPLNAAAESLRYFELSMARQASETWLYLQGPHSPIGRGSGLKIRTVSVRVRLGAPGKRS